MLLFELPLVFRLPLTAPLELLPLPDMPVDELLLPFAPEFPVLEFPEPEMPVLEPPFDGLIDEPEGERASLLMLPVPLVLPDPLLPLEPFVPPDVAPPVVPAGPGWPVVPVAPDGLEVPDVPETAMPYLIVFSHLRWAFVYQRPQHLLSRLAQRYPVLFVEEPVHLDAAEGPPRIDRVVKGPGVTVLVPRAPAETPGFHDGQVSTLKPLLAGYLRSHGIDDSLLWFYTPMALTLASEMRPRAVVYDCMDELSAFKEAPRQLRQRETALLKVADRVSTGGPSLYAAKRYLHPSVHCLPSSVTVAHFAPAALDRFSDLAHEAARLQGRLPAPRLGFFGAIDERLDVVLLDALARAHPEWQIVMVGPVVKIDADRLPRHPNLHGLGMQPYAVLAHLMAGWDVCLMPFALNDSTRFISPIKTLEYFAGGKPVISTAVPDVVALHAGVARIATDHANFIALCEATLADEGVQRIARCEATASAVRGTSWDRTAERARHLIETLLATPAAARQASAAGTSAHGITPHPWGGFGAATQQATVAAR